MANTYFPVKLKDIIVEDIQLLSSVVNVNTKASRFQITCIPASSATTGTVNFALRSHQLQVDLGPDGFEQILDSVGAAPQEIDLASGQPKSFIFAGNAHAFEIQPVSVTEAFTVVIQQS